MSLSFAVPVMAAPSDGTQNTENTGISEEPEGAVSDEASTAESSAYEAKAVRVINAVTETDSALTEAVEEEAAVAAEEAAAVEEQSSGLSPQPTPALAASWATTIPSGTGFTAEKAWPATQLP